MNTALLENSSRVNAAAAMGEQYSLGKILVILFPMAIMGLLG